MSDHNAPLNTHLPGTNSRTALNGNADYGEVALSQEAFAAEKSESLRKHAARLSSHGKHNSLAWHKQQTVDHNTCTELFHVLCIAKTATSSQGGATPRPQTCNMLYHSPPALCDHMQGYHETL